MIECKNKKEDEAIDIDDIKVTVEDAKLEDFIPKKNPKVTKPAFDFPPAFMPGAVTDNPAVIKQQSSTLNNPLVYLDISIAGDYYGRIVLELFANVVPRTCENFRQICTGEAKSCDGKPICYRGSPFHRVVNRFMIQGGDVTNFDGTGGESIYGKHFEDENFLLKHETAGQLSMANSGPNKNGSQFFISTVACPHLDGQHVVFGVVKKGLGIVTDIEALETDSEDRPMDEVIITDCGQISSEQDLGICANDGTQDTYPHHPEDLDIDWDKTENFDHVLQIIRNIKDSGNTFFCRGDNRRATRKYKKCSNYISMLRDTIGRTNPQQEERIRELEAPCILNQAAVCLRLYEYSAAIEECNKILNFKENEEFPVDWMCKATFRRGKAHAGNKNFNLANRDLIRVLKLRPQDESVKKELMSLKKAMTEYKQIEKNIYGKMFSKS